MVEVVDSEDEFKVFNRELSLEASNPDLGPPFSPLIDEMGIQRKPKSSLLDLISHNLGGTHLGRLPRPSLLLPPKTRFPLLHPSCLLKQQS